MNHRKWLLAATDIDVRIGNRDGRTILDGISLIVCNGDRVCILGQNGSGKTTLLDVLSGERAPNSGSVCYSRNGGRSANNSNEPSFPIAYVHQNPEGSCIPDFTVAENLALAIMRGHRPSIWRSAISKVRTSQILEALKTVGLDMEFCHRLDRSVNTLSGGEKQLLALAMVLIQKPSVLLLDEFTASLDNRNIKKGMELVDAYASGIDSATVLVTHDIQRAVDWATRILVLNRKRIVLRISSEEKQLTRRASLVSKIREEVERVHDE